MGARSRAAIAGVAGGVVTFGITELVHGLYDPVPSVLVSVAQIIARLTPGALVTKGIETLGTADVPTLITVAVIGTLAIAAFLANLSRSRPLAALVGVAGLGAIALYATFAEPFTSSVATVLTILAALAAGCVVAVFLRGISGLRSEKKPASSTEGGDHRVPQMPDVRYRESGEGGEISVGRRSFLALSGLATLAGLAAVGVGRALGSGQAQQVSRPHKLKLPGKPSAPKGSGTSVAGSGSKTVTHKTLPPPPRSASIETKGMPELITPAKNFYLIDTELSSPRLDAKTWKLSVKGAVDNPFEMTYKDLLGMSTIEADITLSCVSNPVGGGLVSNGRWTGVLLSDVLKEAGVSRDKITRASRQLVGRSVDGFTTGFKTEIALDGRNALVAFGLNGDQLPIIHGYPVRLVVPGLYGYVSATKWLTEIELTNWSFDAYWIQRTWSKQGPIKTQSRIDTVTDGDTLKAGRTPIGGVAWAPHRGISKVEVSTDNGFTWHKARLARPLSIDTWRQYVYYWDAEPGNYTLKVRATDGTGKTQTARETPPHPSGATGYDTVNVTVS